MKCISLWASLRQWLEAQPSPLRAERTYKVQRDGGNVSIYQTWLSDQANGGSQLVFTLRADWGPSNLMGCTIAAYLQSAEETEEEKSMWNV